MRTLLRIAMEGSAILALAFFSAVLHCTLRSLRSRRTASGPEGLAGGNPARRPVFLSRGDLL
jgi:hypothetical protein